MSIDRISCRKKSILVQQGHKSGEFACGRERLPWAEMALEGSKKVAATKSRLFVTWRNRAQRT